MKNSMSSAGNRILQLLLTFTTRLALKGNRLWLILMCLSLRKAKNETQRLVLSLLINVSTIVMEK